MPGLVPGIHDFLWSNRDVDHRVKPGHDKVYLDSAALGKRSLARSIPSKYWLRLGRKSLEGAGEIRRRHAEGLGDRFRLDRLFNRHRPFHRQHPLGHGVGKSRTGGDFTRECQRLWQHLRWRDDPAKEAPALALLRAHE